MPEPFKNLFNLPLIENMADHLHRNWPAFKRDGFIATAGDDLESLELKQRAGQITAALTKYLPVAFEHAADIMLNSLDSETDPFPGEDNTTESGIRGWAVLPMSQYVAEHGLPYFDLSMTLLKEMTKRDSSEFAIRFFLLAEPDRTIAVLSQWTHDPNRHVRRLVSEGTRPRLPWAQQLPMFITDPTPILPLLKTLRDDAEEYVRRSVANNLNDIAKDHPDTVAAIAQHWMVGAPKTRQRLIRHACRTLIKSGHAGALAALGYNKPSIDLKRLEVLTPTVTFGKALEFEISLASTGKSDQPLIVDYVIHHRKANGSLSPKVFKWKTLTLRAGSIHSAVRRHAIRPITTRIYYPGLHRLEIMVNGRVIGADEFQLLM